MTSKKTKIVATISNKRCEVDFLKSLYEAGMNVVRLNTAHQTPADAIKVIENVRKVSDKIAILVDTKGPEIRTNPMAKDRIVKIGDQVLMKGEPGVDSDEDMIRVTYQHFVTDLKIGSRILIDDGILELEVADKKDDALVCTVKNNGRIQGRKSINIPSTYVKLPSLTQKDIEFIKFAAEQKLDFIAHSFVRRAADVIAVQTILDSMESNIKIISKIENAEGVENIDEILDYSYGIMVARGDLAIEINPENIPMVQKRLVHKAIEKRKPVIVATQMLHTMIENPHPTRAEVNDIANAVYEGTDAIMLSGETAYGKYPLESVQMMTKIALEVEKSLPPYRDIKYANETISVSQYLEKAAVKASRNLPIKAIVADTMSGNTVRGLASYRGRIPVYAQCYKSEVMRQLALSFGIYCRNIEPKLHHQEFITDALDELIYEGSLKLEDMVVVIAGSFGYSSSTSFIEIGDVEKLKSKNYD